QSGQPHDEQERVHRERLRSAVSDVVQKQTELGVSVVNDGEYGKAMRTRLDYGAWLSYVMQRLTGWEPAPEGESQRDLAAAAVAPRGFYLRRDRQAFPEVYADIDREMFAGGRRPMGREITSPITY